MWCAERAHNSAKHCMASTSLSAMTPSKSKMIALAKVEQT
jgi:hypothetical protein